ncbi:MAG TPA: type III-B CRISPR module-associated Cmr3 family protein, partial [Wenzhouxiangella sp.]|nr:type III-B CRISPR module-associated Cmr3 family protein [Wenzhouxiangella sp.]
MTHTYRFMEPVDVLFMRGNKLFGAPGSYGESLVPPWPSLAAGAIRSRMLVDEDIDLKRFADGQIEHPQLGTPKDPGDFTVTAFHLARRHADGRVEILVQPPADLVVSADSEGKLALRRLRPGPVPEGLQSSAPLPLLPILPEDQRRKPVGDRWLTQADWQACLEGRLPSVDQLVETRQLWKIDERIGVGLDPATRSAREGQLFTTQAVSMVKQDHVV